MRNPYAVHSAYPGQGLLVEIIQYEITVPADAIFQKIIIIKPVKIRLGRQFQKKGGHKEIVALQFVHNYSPLVKNNCVQNTVHGLQNNELFISDICIFPL